MIIAAALVLCFFYFRTEDPAEVARDTLNDPDFLKDKEAPLYFSTAADQDTFGGGKATPSSPMKKDGFLLIT